MTERSPIFTAKHVDQQIGYIEGAQAFDLSARPRAIYEGDTGLLRDPKTQAIVGYVSLQGFFAGSSWMAEKLFATADDGGLRQQKGADHITHREAAAPAGPTESVEMRKVAGTVCLELRASNPETCNSPKDVISAHAQTPPHRGDTAIAMTSGLEEGPSYHQPTHAEGHDNTLATSFSQSHYDPHRATSSPEHDSDGARTFMADEPSARTDRVQSTDTVGETCDSQSPGASIPLAVSPSQEHDRECSQQSAGPNDSGAVQSTDTIAETCGSQSPGAGIPLAVSPSQERDLERSQKSAGPNDSDALMVVRSFMHHVSDYLHSTGEAIATSESTHDLAEQQPSSSSEDHNDDQRRGLDDAHLTDRSSRIDGSEALSAEESLPTGSADMPNASVQDKPLPAMIMEAARVSEQATPQNEPHSDEDVGAASAELVAVSAGRALLEEAGQPDPSEGRTQTDEHGTHVEHSMDRPSSASDDDWSYSAVEKERELQRALDARRNELEVSKTPAPRETSESDINSFLVDAERPVEISQSETRERENHSLFPGSRPSAEDPSPRQELEDVLRTVLRELEQKSR
jgi:hypothetical protein